MTRKDICRKCVKEKSDELEIKMNQIGLEAMDKSPFWLNPYLYASNVVYGLKYHQKDYPDSFQVCDNCQYKSEHKIAGGEMKHKLEDFKGNIYLTDDEKEYRISELIRLKEEGEIDEGMIPYLNRFNELQGVMTTQCCSGHNNPDLKPHIDFRFVYTFPTIFKRLSKILDERNVSLQIMGGEMEMPRYVFWLSHTDWWDVLDSIYSELYSEAYK